MLDGGPYIKHKLFVKEQPKDFDKSDYFLFAVF